MTGKACEGWSNLLCYLVLTIRTKDSGPRPLYTFSLTLGILRASGETVVFSYEAAPSCSCIFLVSSLGKS